MHRSPWAGWCLVLWLAGSGFGGNDETLSQSLQHLRAVRNDGQGNREAAAAWWRVRKASPDRIVDVLAAMDGAGPVARNWLACAAEAVAEKAFRQGAAMPLQALERYLDDVTHDPHGRRLAYEWIRRADQARAERLLRGLLNDPSLELRRDAVARVLRQAQAALDDGDRQAARALFQQSLDAARDKDQVLAAAKQLRKLGTTVDLPRHFGFLLHWKLIGPFDNTDRRGFDTVYPPEKELVADAEYEGKNGPVTWEDYRSTDDFGLVDLNRQYGKLKEVVAYAWATFDSPRQQKVELRLGCKTAWKLWLNGKPVFQRNEYHRGMEMDQYKMPVELVKGKNQILLKVCQNEQREDWTVEWQFQLRICDATGTAVLPAARTK